MQTDITIFLFLIDNAFEKKVEKKSRKKHFLCLYVFLRKMFLFSLIVFLTSV